MDIKELNSFKLSDAVKFHDELNPNIWVDNHIDPEVKEHLLDIAEDFISELGISDLNVKDIRVSGSNAAYSYTPHSDLDLHIVIDMSKLPDNEVYQELFNAKKTLYNDSHDITVHDVPVEVYVQDSNDPVISLGEYSILHDRWIKHPVKRRANFDQTATKAKYEKLAELVDLTLETKDLDRLDKVLKMIRRYRQAGLSKGGEFSPENLAYKAVRSQGGIASLYNLRDKLRSKKLSIEEAASEDNLTEELKIQFNNVLNEVYTTKQQVIDHFVRSARVRGQDVNLAARKGAAAWERGWRGPKPKPKKEPEPKTQEFEKYKNVRLPYIDEDSVVTEGYDDLKQWSFAKSSSDYWALQESIEEYYKKDNKWFPHRTHGIYQLISRHDLRESIQDDVKDFWNQLTRLDRRASVILAPGKAVSVIQCWTHLYDSIFEFRGNLTPKKIVDVFYEDTGDIEYVQFEDGSTFPDKSFLDRGQKGELDGIITMFFPSKNEAEQTLTAIRLCVPSGWKMSTINLTESKLGEASGYIPSAKEKNDPRFKTALTVDVKPDAIKKNAKAFGFKTSRAGVPPQANPNGNISKSLSSIGPKNSVIESDNEHYDTLRKTGFWGKQGAGCILFAEDTKKFCIALRSALVEEPGTWGTIGGAIDGNEQPSKAVKRELQEETNYNGPVHLIPMFVFRKNTFAYHNFLAVVPKEFSPSVNWETDKFEWFEFGNWPSPLHPGMIALLSDPNSVKIMRDCANGQINEDEQQELFPGYEEQHRQQRLNAWLQQSHAVAANNKPKILYHATNKHFDAFRVQNTGFISSSFFGNSEVDRYGIFLAENPKFAEEFIIDQTKRSPTGYKPNAVVIPVYLSAQYPFDLTDDGLSPMCSDEETVEEFKKHNIDLWSIYRHYYEDGRWDLFDGPEGGEFIKNLKALGYDSAIMHESSMETGNTEVVWVAFSPTQVKSAIGNRGSFDPTRAEITKETR